jgi:hypothetical protein
LKHCAANRKRRLSAALPNVGIYIYDVNISGFTSSSYIYDISRLRVNFLFFFRGAINRGYWISRYGGTTVFDYGI